MIEFKGVEIKYNSFIAIKELDLVIKAGEFFTFLGPSGCGKTTTLRALAGFIHPTKGRICVNDKDITDVPVEKREIGMVFQSYALFPTMTVYENIAFGLKIKKLKKDEIESKILKVSDKIKITKEQLYRNISDLSGGQQQRVALARAIVLEPEILCLDEPLSNLDAKLRVDLRGELKRLQKDLGITTLYVTHDQEEALTLSDRIAVFNNGYIEQVGAPYDIYNRSESEFVCDFIGDINRLQKNVIKVINKKSDKQFNELLTAFIRVERIHTKPKKNYVSLEAVVKDFEYNGVMTKYSVETMGESIKCIEKNDGERIYKPGENISLYINPKDIMQFS